MISIHQDCHVFYMPTDCGCQCHKKKINNSVLLSRPQFLKLHLSCVLSEPNIIKKKIKMPTSSANKENIFLFVPNIIGTYWIPAEIISLKVIFSLIISPSCNAISQPLPINFSYKMYTFMFSSLQPRTGYGRIILAVIAFYFMRTNYIIAGWCYIISALLDSVDGHAARAFNQSKISQYHHLFSAPLLGTSTTTQFPKSFNICMVLTMRKKSIQARNSALCWTSWRIVAALWAFWLRWATSIRVICSCFNCRWPSMFRVTGCTCNREL